MGATYAKRPMWEGILEFQGFGPLCSRSLSSGYGLNRLFKVDDAERVSLMYGLGMNNNGTGLVLASLVLSAYPRVMVPIIFYNLVQHLVAGGVHEVIGRKVGDHKATGT